MKGKCKFYDFDKPYNQRCTVQECACPYKLDGTLDDCDDYEEDETYDPR
jgi:hypothetical protein